MTNCTSAVIRLVMATIVAIAFGDSCLRASPFGAAKSEPQVSFGDPEGNPKNWPEPLFNESPTPWARIASNYDAIVFDPRPNAMGDGVFAITPWSRFSPLRGENGFGIDSYFGRNFPPGANSYQAVTSMGALLSGSWLGINYASFNRAGVPPNLVRLIKKWFAADVGADVFLNNVHSRGGANWWDDIIPNILACQLSDLYRDRADEYGEPKLADLCQTAIQRWYQVADYLRDGRAIPEFSFKAVQLVPGPVAGSDGLSAQQFQPIASCNEGQPGYKALSISRHADPRQVCFGFRHFNGDTYESDSSAGLAYLGLFGFEKFKKPEFKQLADWGMKFLDQANYNPLYEDMLPYGAYVAARMNAEFGTHYDTIKFLDDIFSTSTIRPHWGMIGKSWNNVPVYGLVGSRQTGYGAENPHRPDYAFAMDTMQFAATMASIPRYAPSTADAIGKYLSEVAHNGRLFYPAFLSYMDPATSSYIAALNDSRLALSVPFEGIKSKHPPDIPQEPFGTGDALKPNRHGAFKTDLSVYSGIYSGAMARLFNTTDVANLYQVDLLATDIPEPMAYPTYLFYNAYGTAKMVTFRDDLVAKADPKLKNAGYMLYDLISKTIVAHAVSINTRVTVPPHHSLVLVAIPEKDTFRTDGDDLIDATSGIIVDFNWHAK